MYEMRFGYLPGMMCEVGWWELRASAQNDRVVPTFGTLYD